MTAADIVAALVKPPIRCAECNCKRGGSACTWIGSGDELTHEEYIAAALNLDAMLALVEAAFDLLFWDVQSQKPDHSGSIAHNLRTAKDDLRTALAAFRPTPAPGNPVEQGER